MYGVGPNVANVTANGEQIVEVTELGLCDDCIYKYDNLKSVNVEIEDGKITKVSVLFRNKYKTIWRKDYNDLTEEEKEKYIPEAEYKLVTRNALKRYEADHEELGEFEELEIKKTGCGCSIL